MTVARAGRFTPLMVRTMRLAPTCSAPVLPAETKASPLPSASIRRPTTMLESFLVRMALAGSSHISMVWVVFTISKCSSSAMFCLAALARMISSLPTRTSVRLSRFSATACAAPFTISSGALSPPMASRMIFMLVLLLHLVFPRTSPQMGRCAVFIAALPAMPSCRPRPVRPGRHSARAYPECGFPAGAECPCWSPSAENPYSRW